MEITNMPQIHIGRIETKLKELFDGKIDLQNIPPNELENVFNSRALSALAIMIKCGIDATTASNCVTDGYDDLGIDAIYVDDRQKILVLVQSKWRKNGTGSISSEEILKFIDGIKHIINLEFNHANNKILIKKSEIESAITNFGYQVCCIFCHTGDQYIKGEQNNIIYDFLKNLNGNSCDDIEIVTFSEKIYSDIYKYLSDQNIDDICIDDVQLSNWGSLDDPYGVYYGTISAAVIGEWYDRYGNRLFAQNLRYFKGNTDVNQGMKTTLQKEPENFFYYNNGIKILCKKITRKAAYASNTRTGLFSLEGVSLVNGAQTTGTIGNAIKENKELVSKATVFVQLIDLSNADESARRQITKLSNTQNRIENKEFAALDPQQERLKTDLGFSNIHYLYKSGAKVEDHEHQISIDEAIVALACLQEDISFTATAKRNVGALTEDTSRPPYIVLFNSNTNAYRMKNSIEVLRAVDKYLQNHETNYQGRDRLALVHGNRFILHLVLQEVQQLEGYNSKMLDTSDLSSKVNTQCDLIIPKVISAMNSKYPEAYPAYIFKNVGKCKELIPLIKIN